MNLALSGYWQGLFLILLSASIIVALRDMPVTRMMRDARKSTATISGKLAWIARWLSTRASSMYSGGRSSRDSASISGSKNKPRGSSIAAIACLLAFVAISAGMVTVVVERDRSAKQAQELENTSPPQYLHRVWVTDRVSAEVIKALVIDPDTQEWTQFTFNGCGDYKITQEIQTGVILCLLKYEEHPGCMSVARHNLGYELWRYHGPNSPPIIVTKSAEAKAACPLSKDPIDNLSAVIKTQGGD